MPVSDVLGVAICGGLAYAIYLEINMIAKARVKYTANNPIDDKGLMNKARTQGQQMAQVTAQNNAKYPNLTPNQYLATGVTDAYNYSTLIYAPNESDQEGFTKNDQGQLVKDGEVWSYDDFDGSDGMQVSWFDTYSCSNPQTTVDSKGISYLKGIDLVASSSKTPAYPDGSPIGQLFLTFSNYPWTVKTFT